MVLNPFPLYAYGISNKGKVRDSNEDAFNIREDLGLFILSDGMGGHKAGEKASHMAITCLPELVDHELQLMKFDDEECLAGALKEAVTKLSEMICKRAEEDASLHGMGATLMTCLIRNATAAVSHMGDSRMYLLRSGVLERLTEDHTIPGMLLQLGKITQKEALNHPARHMLTRHVGMCDSILPEVSLLELEEGDRLLLCSDGLTNMVSEREIGQIILDEPDLEKACKKLVNTANEAGGADNITVVLIQCEDWEKRSRKKKSKISVRLKVGASLRRCTTEIT